VDALETSTLDAGRLSRGRTYARKGMVHPVTVRPGLLKAKVEGSTPWPYDACVHLPALTDAQWDTLLDTVAAQAGRTAALLDGEMPEDLVADARAAGVPLLPEPHELDPECSCPDWGYPCKHAAALCYATAARLDEDPFTLFTLRGRDKDTVLVLLRERRQAHTGVAEDGAARAAAEGVPARDVFAAWTGAFALPPVPSDVPAPEADTPPAPLTAEPPPRSGVTLTGLDTLTRDTARRARRLAASTDSLYSTPVEDALRIAATGADQHQIHNLVTGTGLTPRTFDRLVRALRHGGPVGVAVARDPLTPDSAAMAAARTALAACDDEAATALKPWRNRLTDERSGIQLRLGPDGCWYPYVREGRGSASDWWPCAPADGDPVTALVAARSAAAQGG
jgi:hypothetical protein